MKKKENTYLGWESRGVEPSSAELRDGLSNVPSIGADRSRVLVAWALRDELVEADGADYDADSLPPDPTFEGGTIVPSIGPPIPPAQPTTRGLSQMLEDGVARARAVLPPVGAEEARKILDGLLSLARGAKDAGLATLAPLGLSAGLAIGGSSAQDAPGRFLREPSKKISKGGRRTRHRSGVRRPRLRVLTGGAHPTRARPELTARPAVPASGAASA